ncbi:head GIN domain-containing protein [Nakamurella sp. GG22]
MKRRSLAAVAAALLISTLVASCGFFRDAGAQTTQQRTISGVTAVRVLTSGDLTITAGSTETLSVTAGENQMAGLTSQVIDGTLILDNKSNDFSDGRISYALTVPPLQAVELSGSGGVDGVGVLTGDAQISVTGSGNATLTGLDLSGVTVDMTGSGNVTVAGRATSQQVTGTGSGNYQAGEFATERADVRLSGSGDAVVDVTGSLSATVTGSGSVTYTGNPAEVNRSTTGSGDVVPG